MTAALAAVAFLAAFAFYALASTVYADHPPRLRLRRAGPGVTAGEAANACDLSYGELVERISCPVCGAATGRWCVGDPERDLHIDRILLATGIEA